MYWFDTSKYNPRLYLPDSKIPEKGYRNVLMQSTWITSKLEDLHQNWIMAPCPKGSRVLVIANKGNTKMYNKMGCVRMECYTNLPGGNPADVYHLRRCCILDGVYFEGKNTFYILDVLTWNKTNMTGVVVEGRQYWMETHLKEFDNLQKITLTNEIRIVVLPKIPCSRSLLISHLWSYPAFIDNFPKVDGFLFYKKGGLYDNEDDNCGWLYPYMIPEILGPDITVHPEYLKQRPSDYIDQAHFIASFEEKMENKRLRREKKLAEREAALKAAQIAQREELLAKYGDFSRETEDSGEQLSAEPKMSTEDQNTEEKKTEIGTIKETEELNENIAIVSPAEMTSSPIKTKPESIQMEHSTPEKASTAAVDEEVPLQPQEATTPKTKRTDLDSPLNLTGTPRKRNRKGKKKPKSPMKTDKPRLSYEYAPDIKKLKVASSPKGLVLQEENKTESADDVCMSPNENHPEKEHILQCSPKKKADENMSPLGEKK